VVSKSGGSKSGSIGAVSGVPVLPAKPSAPPTPIDADLAAVVAAWAGLPPAIRAGIVAGGGGGGGGGGAVIPLALAERLGLAPEVLGVLRARDERRKALRTVRAGFKAKEAARVAAVYSSMPKLRPGAPTPTRRDAAPPRFPSRRGDPLPLTPAPLTPAARGVPLTPRGGGVAVPSRSNSADVGPTQPNRGASRAKRPQFADLTSLFLEPRHARRDLRTMSGIVRTVSPLDPDAVSAALERALDLIPLAPTPDGLRRRLRGLARVLVAMERRDSANSQE
jgi:hypothetical protein